MALSVRFAASRRPACFCFIVLMQIVGTGFAEENLPDPTRPPAIVGAVAGATVNLEPNVPVLQSVILSAGKARATISGKEVEVGDTFSGAKVIAIKEGEVTLRSGKEVKVLRLFPRLDKRMISAKSTVNSSDAKSDRLTK